MRPIKGDVTHDEGPGIWGRIGAILRGASRAGLRVLEASAPIAGGVAAGLATLPRDHPYNVEYEPSTETQRLADINAQYRAIQQQIDADSQQQYQRWRDLQDAVNQPAQPLEIPQFTASVPAPKELERTLSNPSLAGLQQQWQQNGVFNRPMQTPQLPRNGQVMEISANPLANQIFGNPFAPKQSSPQFVQPNQVPYRISQPYQPRFSVPASVPYRQTAGDILRQASSRGVHLAQQRLTQQQLRQNAAYRQGSLNHNAVEQLEKGEAISDKGLAQLEHAFDLALHQISDPELRHRVELQKQSVLNEYRNPIEPPSEPGVVDETATLVDLALLVGGGAGAAIGQARRALFTKKLGEQWLKRQAMLKTRKLIANPRQVQEKFIKHAKIFKIYGNYNKINHQKFYEAIRSHVYNPNTKKILGTHRKTENVYHYYNPDSGILVMTDLKGNFISTWELTRDQLWHLLNGGNIQ